MSTKTTYTPRTGHGPLRKRKPSGVILQRMRGHWDDEIRADGGKQLLHRKVRRIETRQWQADARAELTARAA